MANDFTTKVWIIDTAGATSSYPDMVHIKTVYWRNPVTPGDTAVIQQKNGKTLLDMRCEVANQSQIYNLDNKYQGFIVPTLASGTLEIHIK